MIEIMTNRKNITGAPMYKKGRMKGVNNLVTSSSEKIKRIMEKKKNKFILIKNCKSYTQDVLAGDFICSMIIDLET